MSEVKPEDTDPETCPRCGVSLQGLPIPQEYLDKGWYGDKTHYSRKIGVEIPTVYDGVLYWMCPDCSWAWNRWTDKDSRLTSAAGDRIAEHNEDLPEWPHD